MKDSYYAETAYNSSKKTNFPTPDNSKFGFTTRKLRNHPLKRHIHTQCGEYLSITYIQVIELLSHKDNQVERDIAYPGHEKQPWETFKNPKVILETISGVMQFISIPAWVGFFLVTLILLIKHPGWIFTPQFFSVLLISAIPTICYKVCNKLNSTGKVENKNNNILNRRKGTVLIPLKDGQTIEIPFEEFDPYLKHSAHSSGRICYHLCLCHRYSEKWISSPEEQEDEWGVYQLWEFWKQYMDISKPLPDVPKMEPYRSRDPVTAAYDKKHNRPKDYWKNMNMDKADQMQDASIRAAQQYPWGKTREQALVQGWQPSGFGEGDWQQSSQSEIQAQQADRI